MSQLWNNVLVAVKRKRQGDKHTMVKRTRSNPDGLADSGLARKMVEAQNSIITHYTHSTSPTVPLTILDSSGSAPKAFTDKDDYKRQRMEIMRRERALGFDYACYTRAGPKEIQANEILQRLKGRDKEVVYGDAEKRMGHAGQQHERRSGDHFLSNVELIEKTEVFRVTKQMPKGGHLHIHFNACLQPDVLLDVAKTMDCMFIMSDLPLGRFHDPVNYERCEIQFSILSAEKAKENPGNLFGKNYEKWQTMPLRDFLDAFHEHHPHGANGYEWLLQKLVFNEDETHNKLQTSYGAWEKFNGRTRMMKGLFNYETAYRVYTRRLLEDFQRDKIQYAEIRPNFMPNNQLWTDDGSSKIDNWGIMEIIKGEYDEFQKKNMGCFSGLKVIYCTPRSFDPSQVKVALDECIEFKKKWPTWIAGFDLVGEEAAERHPLNNFIPEFLEFRTKCAAENLDIPFLFHCGETLELGTKTDGNVYDALLLGAERIGHGFSLPRHPYVMEQMKSRNVCVELCPVSNEVLGLTPRIGGHALYSLLANNVHCTVSSDNGTFFRTTLSHDFYQVMIGKEDMTLYGWRQLIEWSLEHSRMDEEERAEAQEKWEKLWNEFLLWIIETYGEGSEFDWRGVE